MSLQVLVLDDDKYMGVLLKTLLAELNCETIWSRTGKDAAEKLRKYDFELVIVDFRLPDCDGMTWMSEQRRSGLNTPFIFLTGIPMTIRYQTRLRNLLKVDSILQKPVDPARFLEIVSVVLDQSLGRSTSDEDYEKLKIKLDVHKSGYRKPDNQNADSSPAEFNLESCLETMADSYEPGSDVDDELEQEIYQLKLEYLGELPSLMRDLADKLDEAKESGWTQENVYQALLVAHSIKGTSASLSIEGIPEIFGSIENALKEMHDRWSVNQSNNESILL